MVAFPTYRLFLVVAALLCVLTGDAQAIDKEDPLERRLSVRALDQAFPEADEVGEISGRPAVAEVLIDDALAGYVLSTYDIDPIGGFTGRFSIEPELIVAIPPELAKAIIQNRGWIFPLPPQEAQRVRAEYKAKHG